MRAAFTIGTPTSDRLTEGAAVNLPPGAAGVAVLAAAALVVAVARLTAVAAAAQAMKLAAAARAANRGAEEVVRVARVATWGTKLAPVALKAVVVALKLAAAG